MSLSALLILSVLSCVSAAAGTTSWDDVDTLLRQKGKELPGAVRKYAWPRTDLVAVVPAGPVPRDFEADAVGAPPAGFVFARTGAGAEGRWLVEMEKGAARPNRVLVQESEDRTDYRFPLAIVTDGLFKDVTLSVRGRPLAGQVDQGFGLVWRYRDANNYYVTRCNALEDNCTICHVVDGRRRAFLNRSVKVATNTWHTLKLEAVSDHFTVWFDGTPVLDAHDPTFKDADRVGLWTKADSLIEFDDLTLEPR